MKTVKKKVKETEYHYNLYYKKKKNSMKLRKMCAPCLELKKRQSLFSHFFYEKVKNDFGFWITGFLPEKSIYKNALPHLNKKWLINLDIKDFFTNTKKEYLKEVFDNLKIFNYQDLNQLELIELVTLEGGLPQGSPASPLLANYVAIKKIDSLIFNILNACFGKDKYSYTRYADDLTISTNEDLSFYDIKLIVNKICLDIENTWTYRLAKEKIKIKNNSQLQEVTGITVNNRHLTLCQKEKKKLRAMMHHVSVGKKQLDCHVLGKLNFIKNVDNNYYHKLTKEKDNEHY